jgi:drug/metabolite transporter (DMT)-like permease
VGAVACLPFAGQLVTDVRASSAADLGWVVYLGVFPTAIAFSTYAFALSHMSASNLSVTTYLVPPITVGLSWLLLAEAPPAMAYVGGVLALVGVSLARRRPRARVPEGAPA